jgi:hypothetical protein
MRFRRLPGILEDLGHVNKSSNYKIIYVEFMLLNFVFWLVEGRT